MQMDEPLFKSQAEAEEAYLKVVQDVLQSMANLSIANGYIKGLIQGAGDRIMKFKNANQEVPKELQMEYMMSCMMMESSVEFMRVFHSNLYGLGLPIPFKIDVEKAMKFIDEKAAEGKGMYEKFHVMRDTKPEFDKFMKKMTGGGVEAQ